MKNPTFHIYTGCMFSGKSSRLVSHIDRCKYQHRSVIVFKPVIDDRYDVGSITTHSGAKIEALNVKSGSEILKALLDAQTMPDTVAVDEAWLIPGCADALRDVFRMGISVIVATIDLLANCKELSEVQKMTSWATHIEKCPAVCTVCGQDAYYSYAKVVDDRDIVIGGEEAYESRCFRCHPLIRTVS